MTDEIITVTSVELPVDETLAIRKHRLSSEDADPHSPHICIVTGIHGDELEGQYVCCELARRIRENPGALRGTVDIYPAMNPIGIDSISRGIPAFDLDMNRLFPGNQDGDMNEYLASEIVGDCTGAELCLDIHASNIFLTEVPQIRINELHKDTLVELARHANVDFVWVHGASTVLESTLAYSLNSIGVKTLVVEMGVGMRITKAYGDQVTDGIFSLMHRLGLWDGAVPQVRQPVVAFDQKGTDVCYLNAPASGIYVKQRQHGSLVKRGDCIGSILDPLRGEERVRITAPEDGWLFTTREYPVVDAGSLMGRILKQSVYEGAEHGA